MGSHKESHSHPSQNDRKKEFIPVSLRNRKDLQEAKREDPVYWIWEKDQIKRIKLDPIQSKKKDLSKL